MNTAERTDEIEIPVNLVRLRTGEAPYPSEEDTLDETEELEMGDVNTLLTEVREVKLGVDAIKDRLTHLEANAANTAKVTALEIELAGLKGQLKVWGAVLGVVGVLAAGMAASALFARPDRPPTPLVGQ